MLPAPQLAGTNGAGGAPRIRRSPPPFVRVGVAASVVLTACAGIYALASRSAKPRGASKQAADASIADANADDGENEEHDPETEDTLDCDLDAQPAHVRIPAYVESHGRFGAALCAIVDCRMFKQGHCKALIEHVSHIIVCYASLHSASDVDSVVRSSASISRARAKIMRRLVRMAKSCHVPLVPDTNRLIDEDMQKNFDEIKLGAEEILHNTHLLVSEKMSAHAA